MKSISQDYRNAIKEFGREIDAKITYTLNNQAIELGSDDINSISLHYEGDLLKSIMKQLDIDSNVEIPIGTELGCKFGVKVREGLNLFDTSKVEIGKAWHGGSNSKRARFYIKLNPGQDYAIRVDDFTNLNEVAIVECTDNFSTAKYTLVKTSTFTMTHTFSSDATYLCIQFQSANNFTQAMADALKLMLNMGDEALPYEPYNPYDYIDYGHFIVKNIEQQQDLYSYKITCYDKLLYSMKDYEDMELTYPITVREYIDAICTHLGLTFANSSDAFTNYDKQINRELYLDENGNSLNYTFRDVLDELSQVTASNICINNDDELEVRYMNNTGDALDFEIEGETTQDGTPSPSNPVEVKSKSGLQEVKIITGNNLFDVTSVEAGRLDNGNIGYASGTSNLVQNSNGVSFQTSANWRGVVFDYIYVQPNTTYYLKVFDETTTATTVGHNIDEYNSSKTWIKRGKSEANRQFSFTTSANTYYIRINLQLSNSSTYSFNGLMFNKGTTALPYEPYSPSYYYIDLGNTKLDGIGSYKDKLFRTSGKNLFDKNTATLNQRVSGTDGTLGGYADIFASDYININGLSSITIQGLLNYSSTGGSTHLYAFYNQDKTYLSGANTGNNANTLTLTVPSNAYYIRFNGLIANIDNIMLNEGSTALPYEPYGNGIWYIKKNIGKYVANNDLTSNGTTDTVVSLVTPTLDISANLGGQALADISKNNLLSGYSSTGVNTLFGTTSANKIRVQLSKDYCSDTATANTFLTNNNFTIYYQMTTPTYTKITDASLLQQLNNVKSLDEIDEEYLKDVNVNTNELYGPINTVSLKRSADSDVISISIPENLQDELKKEISISDNQILNESNRGDYIDGILNRLYGLEYYTNDYASTGITFYEPCDFYNVSIGDTKYKSLMLNDEINITQGLEENIHTEIPQEAKTDYTKTSKDDRTMLRTELIVNKQEGKITGLVASQDSLAQRLYSAEVELDDQGARLDIATQHIDPVTGDILELKRTNYEFGANGIIIDDEQGYKSVKNTTGDYYYENDTMIGKYTKDGSVQKDIALFGKYYYGIDENLDVQNFTKDDAMFVAQLYEDGNGEGCFGHFWNSN